MGKTPPVQREAVAPVVLKIEGRKDVDGGSKSTDEDEAVERLALLQHVSLNEYAKELVAYCESGEVSEDMVQQLAQVKNEAGDLEQILHGYALKQLEVTSQEIYVHQLVKQGCSGHG